MSPITQQPLTTRMIHPHSDHELRSHPHAQRQQCQHQHNHRKWFGARSPLALGLIFVLGIALILALFAWTDVATDAGAAGTLLRRAAGDNSSSEPFVKNKLYLIIVFVGLFLVLVAAIALSAWCCRGAFENPLCCPCYLCACCGGLACLECISCGLCAAGLDDLNV